METTRTIGGVSFNGSADINLPGVNTSGNQDTSGNAGSATILETTRTIGGVSFNGSADIDLPGVNTSGNQDTSGTAAKASALNTTSNGFVKTTLGNGTLSYVSLSSADIPDNNADTSGNAGSATILETTRTIGGVSFNGSADIDLPGVNTSGNQDTMEMLEAPLY